MRAIAAVALALLACACAATQHTWVRVDPSDPGACVATDTPPIRGDRELDALTFLAGAWSYWDVDWGQTLFVSRDDRGWQLTLASHGVMGPNDTDVLRIARIGDEVRLACDAAPCAHPSRRLIERGERRVVFGEAEERVTLGLSDDGCTLYVSWAASDFAYEYVRMRVTTD